MVVETRPAAPPEDGAMRGLTSAEAAERRRQDGSNTIGARPAGRLGRQVQQSVTQPLVLLLLLLAGVFAVVGEPRDGVVVFLVALAVVVVEAWTRWRADRAITALSRLSAPRALVWRDSKLREVAPEELVKGDMVLVKSGSRGPADAMLAES